MAVINFIRHIRGAEDSMLDSFDDLTIKLYTRYITGIRLNNNRFNILIAAVNDWFDNQTGYTLPTSL